MRGYFWGVVGCAAAVLASPALVETLSAKAVARQFITKKYRQTTRVQFRLPSGERQP
jgi:hypothetical protein